MSKTVLQFRVRTPSIQQPIGLLSGGNQQKAVFGRWILAQPKLYIFEEPTQGIGTGAKLELYEVIRRLAEQGAAIILLSSDLLELIGLADSILVVAHGSIVDRVSAAEATEERIIGSAVATERTMEVPDCGLVVSVSEKAEQTSHAFPGQPILAHWPYEDPSETQGTLEQVEAAYFRVARNPQIRKPRPKGGISAMVSSAKMALRRVFGSHRSSLWASGLRSSPIANWLLSYSHYNAPEEYRLLAQKKASYRPTPLY